MIQQIRTDAHGNSLPRNLSVDTAPSGIRYYVVIAKQGGKKRKRSTGVPEAEGNTKKGWAKALAEKARIERELAAPGLAAAEAAGVVTFRKFWLEVYRPNVTVRRNTPLPRVRPDAAEFGDDKLIKWWLEPNQLGRLAIKDVTVSYCETLLRRRELKKYKRTPDGPWRTVKPGTILRELGLLGAMWNYAIKRERAEAGSTGVLFNPWPQVRELVDKPDESAESVKVLSEEDEAKLLAVMTPRYQRWLRFMLDSGVRIRGCTCINPDKDLKWVEGEPVEVFVTLKTLGKKKRTLWVPLMLSRTRQAIKDELSATGRWWNAHYSRYPKILKKACERAGVEYLSPHKLRHTFATRYLQTPGSDLLTCSLLLGHKTTAVTQRVYAHLLTDDLRARSAAWVAAQEGPSSGAPPDARRPTAAALRLVRQGGGAR